MDIFIIFFFFLLFLYGGILIWLLMGFIKTPSFAHDKDPALALTIIICARNEESKIKQCLQSILSQDYDLQKIELILVDDDSSDATALLGEKVLSQSKIDYTLLSNPKHLGKKKSIDLAISQAKHEFIILRDADTFTLSTAWLSGMAACYETTKADLIIAPVSLAEGSGFLWAIQAIENNVLALFAAGSAFYKKAFLCNAANMAFTKTIFRKTGGYASHLHIASGDDVLFLEEVKLIPGATITYLKSKKSIVSTYPESGIFKLFNQKIRWASKFKSNKNRLNRSLAFITALVNILFLFSVINLLFGANYKTEMTFFIVLKVSIDFLLLFLASGFIKNKHLWLYALPLSFVYPIYSGVIALCSLIVTPKWKP